MSKNVQKCPFFCSTFWKFYGNNFFYNKTYLLLIWSQSHFFHVFYNIFQKFLKLDIFKNVQKWKKQNTLGLILLFFIILYLSSRFSFYKIKKYNTIIIQFEKIFSKKNDAHQVETKNNKSSEFHQNGTEMIPGMRWSFMCFAKKCKISSYKVDHHEKKSISGRPQTRPLSIHRFRIHHARSLSIHGVRIRYIRPSPSESTQLERESNKLCHKKHNRHLHVAPGNSQDTTNTFLDR